MNAKDQKKLVLQIIGEKFIPSAMFNFKGESYYSTVDIYENYQIIKQLIKDL